jgi:alkanesulfonate monooxygenase SsuD/methylene tetrahydromethanopterin reductase-like flavin-dependent oxidoreductase (luciferase family)
VKVDLLLDPFGATWAEVRTAAVTAAERGFDGLWTWDHLSGVVHRQSHVLECWTLLSALAEAVPGLSIGPMVLNVANRDPGVLAVMAATLQQVSGGRLLLGLGAGGGPDSPYAAEQVALGRPVSGDLARRRAVETAVATLRATWATPGFLRPEPAPPIVIGAFGPRMAELAGRVGDGINTPAGPNLARVVAIARDAHGPGPFTVTASADVSHRARLEDAGVDRLVAYAAAPFLPTINRIDL